MIQKIIHTIFKRRHFWRDSSFSEIAELYASRMLRILALNMTSGFTSIYLYQNGISVFHIALLWAGFYIYKALIGIPMAAVVARFGPKHSILFANLLYIPGLASLALLPTYGVAVLIPMIFFQATSAMLYQIAYLVDFSKVKSVDHAGKEIAYMNIIEKVTIGLSPLIGGILAFLATPQIVLIIAAILFGVAAIPLLKTAEQELPGQKLNFRGMPWRLITRNIVPQTALGYDVFTSGTVWTLFYAISIIGIASDNEVYAANGILTSVVLVAALAASYAYGQLIDHRRGEELLRIGAFANSITHFLRPFTNSTIAVAGLNIANEVATAGYSMSYTRGYFDNADQSGGRIVFISIMEIIGNLGAAIAALVLGILVTFLADITSMQVFFYIASGVVLLIMLARFPLYRR